MFKLKTSHIADVFKLSVDVDVVDNEFEVTFVELCDKAEYRLCPRSRYG